MENYDSTLEGVYAENLFQNLRSREEVFGKFFGILVTIIGSIGYTFIKAPSYVWLAVTGSNLMLLAGTQYISTLSYNYRYLQMCLSKIECLTGTANYLPDVWNLITRGKIEEENFVPDIFKRFREWMKTSSILITVAGLAHFIYLNSAQWTLKFHLISFISYISRRTPALPSWLLISIIIDCMILPSDLLVLRRPTTFTREVYKSFYEKKFGKIREETTEAAKRLGFNLDSGFRKVKA